MRHEVTECEQCGKAICLSCADEHRIEHHEESEKLDRALDDLYWNNHNC